VKSAETAKQAAKTAMRKSQMKTAQKSAQIFGDTAKKAMLKLAKFVQKILLKNKYVVLGIVIILLLIVIITSITGSISMMFSESTGDFIASTYMSEDTDMTNSESYMQALESGLQTQISNIPNVYVGWDEYRYNLAAIGHNPHYLISYLSAKYIIFEYNFQTQNDINSLFNALYTLQITSIHEVRSYTTTSYDDEGNAYTETVYYDYYILETVLIKNDFNTLVSNLFNNPDQYELYQLLLATQGNRPDLF
jgi:hypothetical protein